MRFPLGLPGARARVEHQPKGLVGVIAPWNFPVNLIMGPLAGILAAGNRQMVKTSELDRGTHVGMVSEPRRRSREGFLVFFANAKGETDLVAKVPCRG